MTQTPVTNQSVLHNLKAQAKDLQLKLYETERTQESLRTQILKLSGAIDVLSQLEEMKDKEQSQPDADLDTPSF